MRVWSGLLAMMLVAGCGTPAAVKGGGVVRLSARAPARVDPGALARSLTAVQPGWPHPDLTVDCREVKCVALTFDDGPGRYTPWLLDELDDLEVKATFFVVGQMVAADRDHTLPRMVAAGHEIGNHSWSHAELPGLSDEGIARELGRTQDVVEQVAGVRMTVMRPPYGSTDARVAAETRRLGLAQILWSVDTLDWRDRVPSVVARRAAKATGGSIVLMHDIHRTTVEAVPNVVESLADKGYRFVTISELYGTTPAAGRKYTEL
ncbi:polysaccharide deacetylase family protein [Nonomuraea sp. NPDC003804]|uniref:polysaccharide deacetylase family protein n=1 Tax=Nonomuraea sp. NPDC003804 TaxID=3154547 RepID=UPI0033AD0C77